MSKNYSSAKLNNLLRAACQFCDKDSSTNEKTAFPTASVTRVRYVLFLIFVTSYKLRSKKSN